MPDRCALFFDGNIVTENRPRAFFSGNSFYTSAANRMARHRLPEAVTANDVITALAVRLLRRRSCRRTAGTIIWTRSSRIFPSRNR